VVTNACGDNAYEATSRGFWTLRISEHGTQKNQSIVDGRCRGDTAHHPPTTGSGAYIVDVDRLAINGYRDLMPFPQSTMGKTIYSRSLNSSSLAVERRGNR
jgi:hypothetical protein